MQIMVINLPHQTSRRDRMENLLDAMGLDYVISPGVNGSKLSDDELDVFRHRGSHGLSQGEYGCILSHVECWKNLIESKEDSALILEDDVHFGRNFEYFIRNLHVPQGESCIIKTETFGATVTLGRRAEIYCDGRKIHRLYSAHGGSGSYILNRRAAEQLLNSYFDMKNAVDLELFFPNRTTFKNLKLYQVNPAPNMQDMFFPEKIRELGNDSTINEFRTETKPQKTTIQSLIETFKSSLRPAYRAAYSAVLLPMERKRAKIKFQ